MLATLDFGPNVLAYRAVGRLERKDIERVFAAMDAKVAEPGPLRVYGEVLSLAGLELEALWQELRLAVQRWNSVKAIEKAALVTDLEWLLRTAIWEDRAFRGIEIRTFALADQAEAQRWVQA